MKTIEALNEIKEAGKRAIKDIEPCGNDGLDKYLDSDYEITSKMNMIKALGIDSPKKILDISTCFGWMPWLLRQFGHTVFYTVNPYECLNTATSARVALGLSIAYDFCYEKTPVSQRDSDHPDGFIFKPLPSDLPMDFDVIMATSVVPHSFFGPDRWMWFIDDAFYHLSKGGYLYVSPNHGSGWSNLELTLERYKSERILKGWRVWK